jgi:8-oxo-dGTP diphosphatase
MKPDLARWPRPSVAVDVALLTVRPPGELAVLVHRRADGYGKGKWSLPGTFVHEGETLQDAALRALLAKVGVAGERPEQLRVFDTPGRDDRGWVLSVAHADLVPYERLVSVLSDDRVLARIDGEVADAGGLLFDHDAIVAEAVSWARVEYSARPDPMGLLDREFTLLELQRLHEAVAGVSLPKDSWRRFMTDAERRWLEETGDFQRGSVGKPARLFRRVAPTRL